MAEKERKLLPYLAGIDGLRALAVIAVLLYHAEVPAFSGGFFGVEIFFVISGYLVSSLLLAEWHNEGRIAIARFWLRRARRLLPALFGLLLIVLSFSVIFLPDEVASLRNDALAALLYCTNWYLIFDQKSYFESVGRPSLFNHLWSLAVEEQFYLLWPLIMALGLRLWKLRSLCLAFLLAAAASTLWMAGLYQPDSDASRLYYGTDTRAAGLLLGAALACIRLPSQQNIRRWQLFGLDCLASLALAGLLLCVLSFDEFNPLLYRGGFALIDLLSFVVLAALSFKRSTLGKLLGMPVLRYLGQRSYSLYLWHWPIFMLSRPQLDLPLGGWPLLLLRFGLTWLAAELSYSFIEYPIRAGRFQRRLRIWLRSKGQRQRRLDTRWSFALGVVSTWLLALLIALPLVGEEPEPSLEEYSAAFATNVVIANNPPVPSASSTATASPSAVPASPTPLVMVVSTPIALPSPSPTATASATPEPTATPKPRTVLAVGDSIMLGAADALHARIENLTIDAKVNRQIGAAITLLRERRENAALADVVVVHIGNNNTISSERVNELLDLLADVPRVVIVNLKVPRRWQDINNQRWAEQSAQYPNVILLDWHAASAEHPEFFWKDGFHLRPAGAQIFADMIAEAVQRP